MCPEKSCPYVGVLKSDLGIEGRWTFSRGRSRTRRPEETGSEGLSTGYQSSTLTREIWSTLLRVLRHVQSRLLSPLPSLLLHPFLNPVASVVGESLRFLLHKDLRLRLLYVNRYPWSPTTNPECHVNRVMIYGVSVISKSYENTQPDPSVGT